jgi:archaemetzincin
LSKCVTICAVGPVDESILEHIAKFISARCGLFCKISSSTENPTYAYNDSRRQYNSKLILKHLLHQCSKDTFRVFGVTWADLYVPILKYVYGLAQIDGQCSIISLHRLCPKFYNQPANSHLLLTRVEKSVVHELGHTFGLIHCRDRRCTMYSSTRIEDMDFKQSELCPTCFELFKWYLIKNI